MRCSKLQLTRTRQKTSCNYKPSHTITSSQHSHIPQIQQVRCSSLSGLPSLLAHCGDVHLILVLHDPRRASNRRQILLRGGTTRNFFVPSIHHAVPHSVRRAIQHVGLRIHASKNGAPLSARGIAASDPLVRFLRTRHGRPFLSTRHGGLTSFVGLVALQATHPNA